MNTPYIKKYNDKGGLINPIKESYISDSPNRQQRRHKETRFRGNGKNYHLTVVGTKKYHRVSQIEKDKNGKLKTIIHYL